MSITENHRSTYTLFDQLRDEWNEYRARRRFLASPGLLKTQLDLVKYAPLVDRYMPKWKDIWEKWAVEFQEIYFFELDGVRASLRESIRERNFSPHQHVVMAELLWKYCEGTDRSAWIPDLLRDWHACHEDNAHEKSDFEFYLQTSGEFPREVKEDLLGITIERKVEIPIVITASSSV